MKHTVTVSASDLETLLAVTGIIKNVESALQGPVNDTWAEQHKPRLTEAHDNLAAEWRRSQRPERPMAHMDAIEYQELIKLGIERKPNNSGHYGTISKCPLEWALLHKRGLVEADTVTEVIRWGDTYQVEPIGMDVTAFRLTSHGAHEFERCMREAAAAVGGPQ